VLAFKQRAKKGSDGIYRLDPYYGRKKHG